MARRGLRSALEMLAAGFAVYVATPMPPAAFVGSTAQITS